MCFFHAMIYEGTERFVQFENQVRRFGYATAALQLSCLIARFTFVCESPDDSRPDHERPPNNRDALAIVRVPTEEEEQARAIHRQREQLVGTRKRLEAQGRSLLVNHGLEPVQNWWKPRTFAVLAVPQRELLLNSQPILLALQEKIALLTLQLQSAAAPNQPRGLGKMTSVIIDREIGDWRRFNNRRQIASYTGLCPGEYSSGNTRLQSCVTKHGNPRLRAALVELAWRLVRFQPNYEPVVKGRQILAKGALATGAARKKAIVAVARQLAVDL
jgi:transposase